MKYNVVSPSGKLTEVLYVYESDTGWYWFITEVQPEGYAYGFVHGLEDEWGEIYMPDIEKLIEAGQVWKVPRKNWLGISYLCAQREEFN